VRILSDASLVRLLAEAKSLAVAALVEVHDRAELARALEAGAEIVGINNRDLATFETDVGTTLELLEDVPEDVLVVSESGIRGPEDAALLGDAGVDAILVGETLLRAPDPQVAVRYLATIPRQERIRG